MRDDHEATQSMIERFRVVARDGGFAAFSAVVEAQAACLRCEQGDTEGALEEIERHLTWWKNQAGRLVAPTLYHIRARAEDCLGHRADAIASLDEAIAYCRRFGERWQEPGLLRVKGDLLIERAAREACYRDALALARERGSVAFERRAAASLAELP